MIKKLKNNNSGSTYILKTIEIMALFAMLVFLLDFIFLGVQFLGAGALSTHLAHKIALQGGLIGDGSAHTEEAHFNSRITNQEIVKSSQKLLSYFGLRPSDWRLDVNGQPVYYRGMPLYLFRNEVEYGEPVTVRLITAYNWRFSGGLFFLSESLLHSRGSAMSELF